VKQTPLGKLKKVSGKLLRLLSGQQEKTATQQTVQRLLVVDDEESICFSMSEYFSHHGYKVETARDLDEAERLIESSDFKVIIQDLRLGATRNPDGLDLIRRAHQRNPDTRIIVLTAYGSAEMEDEARRQGASAFLRKPKPLSQVAQVVQGLIESPPKKARSA
jgi:DNA-binding NtrC family response regulator